MKFKPDKRILISLLIFLIGFIVTIAFCAFFINSPQKFSDIVPFAVFEISFNVSAETKLLYILILFSIIICSLSFLIGKKCATSDRNSSDAFSDDSNDSSKSLFFIIAALTSFAVSYLSQGSTAQLPVALIALIALIFYRNSAHEMFCSYILISFSIIGFYWIYALLGGSRSFYTHHAYRFAALITLLPLLLPNYRKKLYILLSMLGSIFSPLILLVFFKEKYSKNGAYQIISNPLSVKICVGILIAAFIIGAIIRFAKKMPDSIEKAITFGPIASILAFTRFDGTGAIIPSDLHHPIENIIGFHQVFELGQKPFSEYIPLSGAYSFLHGAINYLFGNKGLFSNYHITTNLFFLFIAIIIAFLIKKLTGNTYALLLALIIFIPSYNRYAFVFPITLLLINPSLFVKRRSWLVAWFLTSLFHGLYYPVFGASVFLSFVPMGIYQLFKYIKCKELSSDLKNWRFYADVAVCFVCLIVCGRFLIGTLRHTLIFSKAGTVSEGLGRFGTGFPEWFFPNISSGTVKILLWYYLSFFIALAIITIAYLLVLSKLTFTSKGALKATDIYSLLSLAALTILPIVSFVFSFYTKFYKSLFSRALGIVLAAIACLSIYIFKLGKTQFAGFAFAVLVAIASLYGSENSGPVDSSRTEISLSPAYRVPEGYSYISNTSIPKLGSGFISNDTYTTLLNRAELIKKIGPDKAYMSVPDYGFLYLFNIKGSGTLESLETKGRERTLEAIENSRNTGCIFFDSTDYFPEYYLSRWLLTSGEYIYDVETDSFAPSAGMDKESVLSANKSGIAEHYASLSESSRNLYVYKVASYWGNSMETLSPNFSQSSAEYSTASSSDSLLVTFTSGLYGNDADFIYLDIDDSAFSTTAYSLHGGTCPDIGSLARYLYKRVDNPGVRAVVSFTDDFGTKHSVSCDLSNGSLLIPMGACDGWLLNHHEEITVEITDGEQYYVPVVSEIKILKLRDCE